MGKCIRCGKFYPIGLNSDLLCPLCAAYIAEEQKEREKQRFDEASKAMSEALKLPDTLDGRILLQSYQDVNLYVPDPSSFDLFDPGTHLEARPCPDLRDDPHAVCLYYKNRPLAFLRSASLKEMVCDFTSRREKAIAIIPPHSRNEQNMQVSLGFYGSFDKATKEAMGAYSLFKSYKLLGNRDSMIQKTIDSSAITENCTISYDGEKDIYLVFVCSTCYIGYLPPAATRYLESHNAEEDNLTYIKNIEENASGCLDVIVSIGVR